MAQPMTAALTGADLSDFGEPTPPAAPAGGNVTTPAPGKGAKQIVTRYVQVPPPVAFTVPEQAPMTDFGEDDEPPAAPAKPAPEGGNVTTPAPAAEAPKPAPEVVTHPPELVEIAAKYGIAGPELGLYSTEELRQELIRFRRDALLRQQHTPAPAHTPAPEPTPEPVTIDWGTHDAPEGEGKRAWKDDDISPAIAKVVKDLTAELRTVKKQLAEVQGGVRQQAVAPIVQQVTAEVAKFGAFFGNARPAPGSPESARCAMLMQGLADLTKANPNRPVNPAVDVPHVIQTLWGMTAGAPAGGNVTTPAPAPKPAEPDPELEVLKRGYANVVQRPTAVNRPAMPKGEAAAKLALNAALRDKGFKVDAVDDGDGFE